MTAPKLPEPFGFIAHPLLPDVLTDGWHSGQMRDYGLACALLALEEAAELSDEHGRARLLDDDHGGPEDGEMNNETPKPTFDPIGFARAVLDDWPDIGTYDGFDLQDLGEKYGLLVGTAVTAPCGENCGCLEHMSEEEFAAGHTCYRLAKELRT